MDDLVQFLRGQLDEDEATARAVQWDGSNNHLGWGLPASATVDVGGDQFYAGDRTIANHIARHDPDRVLAEVEAKRQFITLAFQNAATLDGEWGCCHDADAIEAHMCEEHPVDGIPELRLLALPFAAHPDYRPEWRP